MIPVGGLQPGQIRLDHGTNLLGVIEDWGEWVGLFGPEDLKATHVEVVSKGGLIGCQNPPASCLYGITPTTPNPKLSSVYALKAIALPGRGDVVPGSDPAFLDALDTEIRAHLHEPYDWSQIARFTGIGLLARVTPDEARALLKDANPLDVARGHFGVCSQWTELRIENALTATYGIAINLFEGTGVGYLDARPSDWPLSKYLYQVEPVG